MLKDSNAYLDHINGKKHQRALGYSMRVERAEVDQVKSRLDSIKRKLEEQKKTIRPTAAEDYESKINRQLAEDEGCLFFKLVISCFTKHKLRNSFIFINLFPNLERKKAKKERQAEQKRREMEAASGDAEDIDPEIAALLGFGSFGGGK